MCTVVITEFVLFSFASIVICQLESKSCINNRLTLKGINEEINGDYIFVCAVDGDVLSACEDERWIDYMESDYHSAPDAVFVDKKPFRSVEEFDRTGLGEYLSDAYRND